MNSIVPGTEQYDEFGNLTAAEMDTPQGRTLVADPLLLNIAQKAAPAPAPGPTPPPLAFDDTGMAPPPSVGAPPPSPLAPLPPSMNAAPTPGAGAPPMPPAPLRGPPLPPGFTPESGSQLGTPAAPPSAAPPPPPSFGGPGIATLDETQITRRAYDPALEKEQRDIVRKGQAAIKASLDAELAMSKVAEQSAQAESQLLQTQIDADKARRDAQRQAADAAKRAADEALSRYEGMELEPGRVWANASTGDRMLAGLSMLMGAWGATMTGDKVNPALAAIEKIMEKDLEVQKATIAKGKDVAGARASLYKDLLAAHRDEDAAAAGVRELAWKGLASRARAAEAKVKDPAIKAKYEAAAVELEAKANEEALKRSERSVVTSSKQVPLSTPGSAVKFNDDLIDAGKAAKITAAKNVHQKADHILQWAQKLSPQDREKMFGFIDKPANELASWLGITQDPDYVAGKISRENLKKMALFRLSGAGVPVAEDVKFDAILPNFKNYDNFVTGMAKFRDEMADEYNNEINTAVSAAAHPERKRMIMGAFPLLPSRSKTEELKNKYRTK